MLGVGPECTLTKVLGVGLEVLRGLHETAVVVGLRALHPRRRAPRAGEQFACSAAIPARGGCTGSGSVRRVRRRNAPSRSRRLPRRSCTSGRRNHWLRRGRG